MSSSTKQMIDRMGKGSAVNKAQTHGDHSAQPQNKTEPGLDISEVLKNCLSNGQARRPVPTK